MSNKISKIESKLIDDILTIEKENLTVKNKQPIMVSKILKLVDEATSKEEKDDDNK